MGFRFQRRINLGHGWGLNTSRSGSSLSYRSRQGSIGTKGYSLRTGIPGLTYRKRWGKNSGDLALIALAFMLAWAAATLLIKVLVYAVPLIWHCSRWIGLTLYDLCMYGAQKMHMTPPRAPSSPGQSAVRDALIGGTVCSIVCLLFLYRPWAARPIDAPPTNSSNFLRTTTSDTGVVDPNTAVHPHKASHTALKKGAPETTEAEVAASPSKPTLRPIDDDLARLRSQDPGAAVRIDTYCQSASANTTTQHVQAFARCRRDELAAWMRLVLYNEFPAMTSDIRLKCQSPPFPKSFVAEEVCARYETNPDHAH